MYVNTGMGCLKGLDAHQIGVELEATYKPVEKVEVKGSFSWGDWIYLVNVDMALFDANQQYVGDYKAYIKDVHVGNAAQMTAALGVTWEPFKGFKIGADANYFGKNYADFDPTLRKDEETYDSWKIPNYFTVDANASYRLNLNKVNISFFTSANNILNRKYIADAKDATINGEHTALVYYGFGTTWSAGMKVNF